MNIRLFLIAIIFFCSIPSGRLLSQNVIEGKVIDSEDKRPVHGAVVTYGTKKIHTKTTDANGMFSVPDYPDYPIKIQCLGYETTTTTLSALKKQKIITLKLSPFSLAPVEISADAAQKLVQKAIFNTKNKMIINKYMIYITHITESEYLSKEKRDFYFKYAASQKKRTPKKDAIPFSLWLMNLRHVELPPDTLSSWIMKQNSGLSQFHLHRITDNFDNRYVTILSSDNESTIKLESYPGRTSGSDLKNIYYINSSDTTLISVRAESIESRIAEKKFYIRQNSRSVDIKSKLLKMSSSIDFAREGEQIYFSGSSYNYIYSYFINDVEEIGVSHMENKFKEMQNELVTKKLKKIDNNARLLYNKPDIIDPDSVHE